MEAKKRYLTEIISYLLVVNAWNFRSYRLSRPEITLSMQYLFLFDRPSYLLNKRIKKLPGMVLQPAIIDPLQSTMAYSYSEAR
jgi:hypothetical protein